MKENNRKFSSPLIVVWHWFQRMYVIVVALSRHLSWDMAV